MIPKAIQTYCINPSPSLQKERDDLAAELMAWLRAKAEAGARPAPLQAALSQVEDFASGRTDEANDFWERMHLVRLAKQEAS